MSTAYETDGNVVYPHFSDDGVPPNRVISKAADADLEIAIVCGYDKDGREYFASSSNDAPSVAWILDRFRFILLRDADA